MTDPRRFSPTYVVSIPMGLDGVAAEELAQKVPQHQIRERSSREITFCYGGSPHTLLSLRSVNDVWLVVRVLRQIGSRHRDLRQLHEQLAKTHVEPCIDALRPAGVYPKRVMTFTATCSLRGRRDYRRLDALQSLERALLESSGGKLRPVRSSPDLRLWLHLSDEQARLCLALTKKPVGLRDRAVSLPTSLPGPVAYAMAALTRPRSSDIFVDPVCGSGSIALERAENWRYRHLVAGDVDGNAVSATRINFGPRHRPREFLQWDAVALPLRSASVDAMACNPPHGVQMRPIEGLGPLYGGLLAEAARVLKPHTTLTFLTPERDLTDQILAKVRTLRIEHCFVIDLLGQRPYFYVLMRI